MKAAGVPGLSMFVVQNGSQHVRACGVVNRETKASVNNQTVFEAASLSKPIVACAALQLISAGKLDLDEPLSQIVGPLIPGDPNATCITARHVLSHTTGLPNWRSNDFPLGTYFTPGSHFSYSGEGFVYLQLALERLTAEPLDLLLDRMVLGPLGMRSSSFIWRDSFNERAALGHTSSGKIEAKYKPGRANAAFSLHTTAADYGRFLIAVMEGALLPETIARRWLEPQVPTPRGRFEALESDPPETEDGVFWGLGWGLEPENKALFHWGSNPGMTSFVLAMPAKRTAFVAFTNSDRGLDIVPGVVEHLMPGPHPSLRWLGLSPRS